MNDKELRALAEAATPGPWKRWKGRASHMAVINKSQQKRMYSVEGPDGVGDYEDWGYTKANATYMAAASPDVVLNLLDRVEKSEPPDCRTCGNYDKVYVTCIHKDCVNADRYHAMPSRTLWRKQ